MVCSAGAAAQRARVTYLDYLGAFDTNWAAVHRTATGLLKKGALAGALLFQAYSFAPDPHAPAQLPPDSMARAVATGNTLLLERSFAEAVDVNAAGDDGRTALLVATEQGDRDLVQRLLQAGANVDAADNTGMTPLMAAAAKGPTDVVRAFAERSTRIDAQDTAGRSAAHHAIAAGQFEAAEILVPLMPTMQVAGADGRDLIAMACDAGNPRLLEAVLTRADAGLVWTAHSQRALKSALSTNDHVLTRLLLAKHAGPPTVDGRAIPLLAQAIATDDRPLFDALLAAGADPNTTLPIGADKEFLALLGSNYVHDYVKGDDGVTVLMLASAVAKPEYVRALLDAGAAKSRLTARYKMMALYFAARTDKWRTVQILLGSGQMPEKLRVQISLASQRATVIKDGTPVFETPCSTGRPGFATPSGQFVITDKRKMHKSSIYHVNMPFFMRLNCRDFGMHQGVVPNYPASHGCIRLPTAAAAKLFAEIPVGTVVIIN